MRILLIVQPERFDFYEYLKNMPNIEWSLLWYEQKGQMEISPEELPIPFKNIYHWLDFSTPSKMLDTIKVDKIIFFEIIDLRQISLIVTCKFRNVRTFYLEHGAAGDKVTAMKRWHEEQHLQKKRSYLYNRILRQTGHVFRSKYFYYSASKYVIGTKAFGNYLLLPLRMLRGLPNKILSTYKFRERAPDYSINFNKANFEEYELYTGVAEKDALLTGLPLFDKYFQTIHTEEDHIVYIDTPFLDTGLLDWDEQHLKKVAGALASFAERNRVVVYIKLHPISNRQKWEAYTHTKDWIKIIQSGDYTELYLKAKLILGFSSSMITGLICARKNIVILGWHPRPSVFGVDFSNTGLCHLSLYLNDLEAKYDSWIKNNLSIQNSDKYEEFLKRFNWPFDGKATERVFNAINEL